MRSSAPALVALLAILVAIAPSVGLVAASGGSGPAAPRTGPALERPGPPAGEVSDAGALSATDTAAGVAARTPNLTRPDPAVVITVNLTADGDARWTVASRFEVSNETEAAAFGAFADTVKQGGRNQRLGYSAEAFQRFADVVENGTNRSGVMAVRNATWSDSLENGTGTVALSFTWTNFARTESGSQRVVLDDVFAASNGTWFGELSDRQRLVINPPGSYGVESSRFPVDEGTIVLDGPRDLDTGGSPIVYVPVEGSDGGDGGDGGPGTPTPGPSIPLSPMTVAGAVVVLLAVVLGGLLFTRRTFSDGERDEPAATPGSTDGGEATARPLESGADGDPGIENGGPKPVPESGAGAGASAEASAGGTAGTPGERAAEGSAGGTGGGAATAGAAETGSDDGADESEADQEDEDEVDVELLSDEERVERLLSQNGGRMKQANIVTETGWSNAKVSQLLSSMDEDDRIDKLRIGRENLITLPDEDVGEID